MEIEEWRRARVNKIFMYKKFKMLVVDDEKDLAQLMRVLLKNSDAEIISALSLADGKELWEKNIPPIVLIGRW